MQAVVLIIHLVICVALICLVLLQRSEGGALGIGGGSGSLMTGRGAADTLARMTSFAGGFFLVTSLALTWMTGANSQGAGRSVFDIIPHTQSAPATTTTTAPVQPTPTPPPAGPDPTQSSAPQAVPPTELASLSSTVPAGATIAPAPTNAAARAGPVNTANTGGASTRTVSTTVSTTVAHPIPAGTQQASTTRPAVTQPAATQQASTTRPAGTQAAGTQPAATQPQTTGQPRTQQASVPATTGGSTGTSPVRTNPQRQAAAAPPPAAAATPLVGVPSLNQTDTESSQTQTGVEVVRRDHAAGPDQ